jgi:hypothetical protein
MANVPDGNAATNERQPTQTQLMWIDGSPEGVEFGPAGLVRVDYISGNWYRKGTTADLNTGWELMTSGGMGGGNFIGVGPPDFPAPDGSRYTDRTNAGQYYYDAIGWGAGPDWVRTS